MKLAADRLPEAWRTPEPAWAPMAAGIRWLMHYPTPETVAGVARDVAKVMAGVYADGDVVLALSEREPGTVVEQVTGQSAVVLACLMARRCLIDWEGVVALDTNEPADPADPLAIRAAIIDAMAPGRPPAMVPLLAWYQRANGPIREEIRRLRTTAAAHWRSSPQDPELAPQTISGIACWDLMLTQPELWCEAEADRPAGLDYSSALIAFERTSPPDVRDAYAADYGAAYECFRAIEAGRLEGTING